MRALLIVFCLIPGVLLSQQNVGINIDTPTTQLDVRPAYPDQPSILNIATQDHQYFARLFSGFGPIPGGSLSWAHGRDFSFGRVNPDGTGFDLHTIMTNSGRVGIGTYAPLARLHVLQNSNLEISHIEITEDGDDYARLKFTSTLNPGARWTIAGQADTLQDNSRMNFYYNGPEGVGDRLTIRGNGNIGIQTFTPEATLDIKGGRWNLAGGSQGDVRIGNSTHNLRIGVSTGGGGAGNARFFGTRDLHFGTQVEEGQGFERLTIRNDGNVGIQNTVPEATLDIKGGRWNLPGGDRGDLRIGDNTYNFRIGVSTGGGGAGTVRMFASNQLHLGIAGSENLTIEPGGQVGIGTVDPDHRLHVVGDMRLNGAIVGPDNNGSTSALKIQSTGSGQTMLIDGNEIDVISGGQLALNGNSWLPVTIGGGSVASGYKLCVSGKIIAEEMRVQLLADWPDYVFAEDYHLPSLHSLEKSINKLGHLPGVPSAAEVEKSGIEVGEMQRLLLEKIEELTLYTIEQEKRIEALEAQLQAKQD